MRKLATIFCLLFLVTANTNAQNLQEEINLDQEFSQLNAIENHINKNNGVTLQQLEENNSTLLDGITIEKESKATSFLSASETLGIPPFWWGFCLGFWGIIIVYIISDNDKAATKKALNGCITIGVATAAIYIILFAVGIFATSTSYYY